MVDRERWFEWAEDADSVIAPARREEKGEGAFYIWTQAEIESALGQPAATHFCRRFGVEPNGNVHEDPHGEFTGKNILYQAHESEDPHIAESMNRLLAIRSTRVPPHLDDKLPTACHRPTFPPYPQALAT